MQPSQTIRRVFFIRDLDYGGAKRQLVTLTKPLVERGLASVRVVHF